MASRDEKAKKSTARGLFMSVSRMSVRIFDFLRISGSPADFYNLKEDMEIYRVNTDMECEEFCSD